MKFIYIVCLFTLIITYAYSMAVSVKGVQCTAHIVVQQGDNCSNYIHNQNVEMSMNSLLYLNPSKYFNYFYMILKYKYE